MQKQLKFCLNLSGAYLGQEGIRWGLTPLESLVAPNIEVEEDTFGMLLHFFTRHAHTWGKTECAAATAARVSSALMSGILASTCPVAGFLTCPGKRKAAATTVRGMG